MSFFKNFVEKVDERFNNSLIVFEDIVMIKDGSVGKMGINLTEKAFVLGSTAVKIVPRDPQKLLKKYLYYWLLMQKTTVKECSTVGTSIKHLKWRKFKSLKIWVPPLEEQIRIVKILDKFSELEHRQKQYEYYRKLLIEEPTYRPPRNKWEFKEYKLGDLCEIMHGISKTTSLDKKEIPVVLAKNIKNENITTENVSYLPLEKIDIKKISWVKREDIVIVKDGSVGKLGVNLTNIEFLPESTTMKISSKNSYVLNKKYLYYFLLVQQAKFGRIIFGGTTIQHIRKEDLKTLKITLPTLKHQEKIVNILDKFSNIGISAELTQEIISRRKIMSFYIHKLTNPEKILGIQ